MKLHKSVYISTGWHEEPIVTDTSKHTNLRVLPVLHLWNTMKIFYTCAGLVVGGTHDHVQWAFSATRWSIACCQLSWSAQLLCMLWSLEPWWDGMLGLIGICLFFTDAWSCLCNAMSVWKVRWYVHGFPQIWNKAIDKVQIWAPEYDKVSEWLSRRSFLTNVRCHECHLADGCICDRHWMRVWGVCFMLELAVGAGHFVANLSPCSPMTVDRILTFQMPLADLLAFLWSEPLVCLLGSWCPSLWPSLLAELTHRRASESSLCDGGAVFLAGCDGHVLSIDAHLDIEWQARALKADRDAIVFSFSSWAGVAVQPVIRKKHRNKLEMSLQCMDATHARSLARMWMQFPD